MFSNNFDVLSNNKRLSDAESSKCTIIADS